MCLSMKVLDVLQLSHFDVRYTCTITPTEWGLFPEQIKIFSILGEILFLLTLQL